MSDIISLALLGVVLVAAVPLVAISWRSTRFAPGSIGSARLNPILELRTGPIQQSLISGLLPRFAVTLSLILSIAAILVSIHVENTVAPSVKSYRFDRQREERALAKDVVALGAFKDIVIACVDCTHNEQLYEALRTLAKLQPSTGGPRRVVWVAENKADVSELQHEQTLMETAGIQWFIRRVSREDEDVFGEIHGISIQYPTGKFYVARVVSNAGDYVTKTIADPTEQERAFSKAFDVAKKAVPVDDGRELTLR